VLHHTVYDYLDDVSAGTTTTFLCSAIKKNRKLRPVPGMKEEQ